LDVRIAPVAQDHGRRGAAAQALGLGEERHVEHDDGIRPTLRRLLAVGGPAGQQGEHKRQQTSAGYFVSRMMMMMIKSRVTTLMVMVMFFPPARAASAAAARAAISCSSAPWRVSTPAFARLRSRPALPATARTSSRA